MSKSSKTPATPGSMVPLGQLLMNLGLQTWTKLFEEHKLTYAELKDLTAEDLKHMRIEKRKDQQQILNSFKMYFKKKDPFKVFNDPIYGSIELHPLLVKIIDTPQFQRLRNIKQLSGGYFVYPGACHNRFEHSIGVAHLAGELAHALKAKPSLKDEDLITDKDILCVQIAGLCHDLGHGPFSHLFDDMFLKKVAPDVKHEDISIKMFKYLLEENGLKPLMKLYDVMDEDLTVIEEMINPKKKQTRKPFLFEIISNKTSGIDVDKFDYFARDSHHLGIPNSFDYRRFLRFARLCTDKNGEKHICIRDKEVNNLYLIFQTRYLLHRSACQHKVKYGIDLMIKDAFVAAKDKNLIKGPVETITEAINDMAAYTKLTDHVFEEILYSTHPDLKEAREILERIIVRDLYKCLIEVQVPDIKKDSEVDFDQLKQRLAEEFQNEAEHKRLTKDDFEIVVIDMDYGMEEKDPVEHVYFYEKSDLTSAILIPKHMVSQLLPKTFSEKVIRVYCKKTGRKDVMEAAKEKFEQWCRENGFSAEITVNEEEKEVQIHHHS